jgi:hypothetical protein
MGRVMAPSRVRGVTARRREGQRRSFHRRPCQRDSHVKSHVETAPEGMSDRRCFSAGRASKTRPEQSRRRGKPVVRADVQYEIGGNYCWPVQRTLSL